MKELNLSFIKNKRIELEMTLQDMADALGMKNASTYMKYENGVYSFRADQLPRLAIELGCEITDFFSFKIAERAIFGGGPT